jgi:hypothetical protein
MLLKIITTFGICLGALSNKIFSVILEKMDKTFLKG